MRGISSVCVLLSTVSACEYDALVSVNAPDIDRVVTLGNDGASVAFVLVDDRGGPVEADEIVDTAGGAVRVSAATLGARIEGAAWDGVPIPDDEVVLEWIPAETRVLALVIEGSADAVALDPADERLLAADAAARAFAGDGRRVAVFAASADGVDERLPPSSDDEAIATAIAGVALVEGGTAPLAEAIEVADDAARASNPAPGAILVVGAGLDDAGGSFLPALGRDPTTALHVVALRDEATLRDGARATGGVFVGVETPAALVDKARAVGLAASGRWRAVLPAAEPAPGARLTGTLIVTVGGEERAALLAEAAE